MLGAPENLTRCALSTSLPPQGPTSQMKKTKEKTIPFPPPQISFKEMAVERMMSSPGARSWFHRLISFFGCQPVELSSPFERLSFRARRLEEKEEDRDGWRRECQESIRLLISSFVFFFVAPSPAFFSLSARALERKEQKKAWARRIKEKKEEEIGPKYSPTASKKEGNGR